VVGIPACAKMIGPHPYHCVGEKYLRAVLDAAHAIPMLIPAVGDVIDPATWLARIDGVLFTGSHSNVEPHHYAGVESEPGTLHDSQRDATTLPLLRLAVATGVPILAICRGFQEMNVAFGGSLHQKVQDLPGYADHREDTQAPLEQQYEPVHPVRLAQDGLLQSLLGIDRVQVNSLHAQGLDRLAPTLTVEATAPDGLVEAVRVRDADAFAVGVQWHPEWRPLDDPMSRALFGAFGAACRLRARNRRSAA
jgi:putative glutamine amidotransferase